MAGGVGSWAEPLEKALGIVGVHAVVMYTGKVLYWCFDQRAVGQINSGTDAFQTYFPDPNLGSYQIWDPASKKAGPVGAIGGYRDHDTIDHTGLQQAVDGAFDEGEPVELEESLRHTGREPFTGPGGRDNCDRAAQSRPSVSGDSGRGGQNLVEDGLRFGIVGALGQRQLPNQNLPCLGQHALLAGGQAAFLVAAPQIAHYLSHLVDVP